MVSGSPGAFSSAADAVGGMIKAIQKMKTRQAVMYLRFLIRIPPLLD
jgi:hypothetical protein